MKTDILFYRLFQTSPAAFFILLGMPPEAANDFDIQAIELKETSSRVDCVFLPRKPALPAYFVEVQFYRKPTIYAGLMANIGRFLTNGDPTQEFRGVVVYSTRTLEPNEGERRPYKSLLEAGDFQAIYLDEQPDMPDGPLGMAILQLIRRSEEETPSVARKLIQRTKDEFSDEAVRDDLIQLIETVVIYKLTDLSIEEIQKMLQVDDIRNTRVYQQALEEGRQEGREEGREEGRTEGELEAKRKMINSLAAEKMDAKTIAKVLGMKLSEVRKELNRRPAK